MKRIVLGGLLVLLACSAALSLWDRRAPETGGPAPRIAAGLQDPVARGAYLATVANCRGCHTAPGGPAYAGGRAIPTRFGRFFGPNLTPDRATGLGDWSADDFWRALHDGRSRDGRPLYPVFPYTHYTRMTREDADALFAYLRTQPAVQRPSPAHEIDFPYDQRVLLHAWRALFFSPGEQRTDPSKDEAWNRGAYLVQGLGHCGACHEARNALGAVRSREKPAGGLVLDWYAPSLDVASEAGVAHLPREAVVQLMRDGVTGGASTLGPMAEVVYDSLQHWQAEDLEAMVAYLQALPPREAAPRGASLPRTHPGFVRGAALYAEHCADCHGEKGEGRTPSAPALAGNRALTMASPVNPIRVVLYGGYAPGTAGNPQPYGMPPYHAALNDGEIADLLGYVRGAWGNEAPPVSDFEVTRQRTGPLW